MFSEVENFQAALETILGVDVPVLYQQDSSTLLAVLKTGYSAKLRHANRVHRANIASVCERLAEPRASIAYCKTDEQRANGFTKSCHHRNGQLHLNKWAFCLTLLLPQHLLTQLNLLTLPVPDQTPDVEAIAGSLSHRLSEEHILRLLGHLPNDGAVRGPSHSEVHCFTVGAYCHGGGIAGIRNNTTGLGKASGVLARFVQQRFRNHQLAAIGLFQGQCTSLHSAAWNEPES